MRVRRSESPAELIAAVLTRSWQRDPPELEVNEAGLAAVTRKLIRSGAGALAWWRVRHSPLGRTPTGSELRQAYRFQTLQAAVKEQELREVYSLLREAGVEPLLLKGWAVARLYPEPGLRQYLDHDLCVGPEEYLIAKAVKDGPAGINYPIDLHRGSGKLDDLEPGELYERAQTVRVGDVVVRIPCPEDHLRILCLHLMRHGACRPLWLCDVAVALESRSADFDWGRCLSDNRRRADAVACTIGLAHHLLGARVDGTPVARRAERLPSWLLPGVLKQWEAPYPPLRFYAPMATYLENPKGVFRGLRNRWPDPIEATASVNGPLNELPRLPFQLANCALRTARFLGTFVR